MQPKNTISIFQMAYERGGVSHRWSTVGMVWVASNKGQSVAFLSPQVATVNKLTGSRFLHLQRHRRVLLSEWPYLFYFKMIAALLPSVAAQFLQWPINYFHNYAEWPLVIVLHFLTISPMKTDQLLRAILIRQESMATGSAISYPIHSVT